MAVVRADEASPLGRDGGREALGRLIALVEDRIHGDDLYPAVCAEVAAEAVRMRMVRGPLWDEVGPELVSYLHRRSMALADAE